jgi:thiol-disulfide isomerase/thioredoxin
MKSKNGLVVVNFYASFCQPCNEELPGMLKTIRELKDSSVNFLVVSLDEPNMYPKKLGKFLRRKKIQAPIVWLQVNDVSSFCPKIDARWSGSIPATLFLNNLTGYRKFIEDELTADAFIMELNRAINALL